MSRPKRNRHILPLRGPAPTPHSNIGDISYKNVFRAVSSQGFSSPRVSSYRGIYSRGIHPKGIHLMEHSPRGAFIPRCFHFRAIRHRGFRSRGIVNQGKPGR